MIGVLKVKPIYCFLSIALNFRQSMNTEFSVQ